jgi:hypothetical protein
VWTCDAWLLLTRRPQLDWDRFTGGAERAHLALPLAALLAYLARELDAPVPDAVLAALERAARRADSVGRQIAVEGVRRAARVGLRELARRARSRRDRLALARWLLIPSPGYVRLVSEDHGPRGVLRYCVERALRYARRRLRARRSGAIAQPAD